MLTIAIMLATVIQTLDSTIANVALPHMQGSLSASQDEITWVLDVVHHRRGHRDAADRMALRAAQRQTFAGDLDCRIHTGIGVLRGLSETLTQIVASRLLQGIFGASLVPLSQSILLDINPREKQGQARPCGAWA